MKYIVMTVAFLLVGALAIAGTSVAPVAAQGGATLTTPDNPTVENGDSISEVVVSWDAVPEAKFYRIAWVSFTGWQAEGWDAVRIASVENQGQTSYTLTNLDAGILYAFRFGVSDTRFEKMEWSGWTTFTVGVSEECASDRDVLVELYEATGGDNWLNRYNWNSDSHPEHWNGVDTDRNGCVTQLRLGNNRLSGSIPTGLSDLAHLDRLYLDGNQLSGGIPSELGDLSRLERLYLHDNRLSGTIPSELGGLANLERLYLYDNRLSGAIPRGCLQSLPKSSVI